ncbi:hypothetical protein ACHAQH_000267 [Verticillium albo-atrum]
MASADLHTDGDEFWLFGYGQGTSLPQVTYLTCFTSMLNPASQDHRGTPEAPGRVVTLIERSYWSAIHDAHDAAPDRVWGVAYRIRPDKVAEVRDYLDIREINGYTIHHTPFHPASSAPPSTTTSSNASSTVDTPASASPAPTPIRTLVYIGTPDNDQFTGPQDPQALAAHIRRSVGPSGLNTDYLFNLDRALDELSPDSGDDHIRDLTRRVRAIMAAEGPSAKAETRADDLARMNIVNTEEQEETEH